MAHIHELIDFTVVAYIVHDRKVLMVHHKKLDEWLPVGGHIELHENTDEALFREIEEESGLAKDDIEVIENRPDFSHSFLLTPQYMDMHDLVNTKHRHIGLIYLIKSKTGRIKLNPDEHNSIKWFSEEDLDATALRSHVRFVAKEAIKTFSPSDSYA